MKLGKPDLLYVLNHLIAEGKTTEKEVLRLVAEQSAKKLRGPQPPAKKG